MKPIIDISYYQVVTDWLKVRDAVEAVIIRMGYRGYGKAGSLVYDSKYREFRKACESLNIPHSFYFFPQSINDQEAIQEADFIIKELQDAGDLFCPVWLDSEEADTKTHNGRADHLTKAQRTWFLKIIAQRVNDAGFPCGIYASKSWLENKLNMKDLPYPVWCAQYSNKCTYNGTYILWQYSSKAAIPGIKGNVDVSTPNDKPVVQENFVSDQNLMDAINVIAHYVIKGHFGMGHEIRKENIYKLVRDQVNRLC